ncbi:hypothetical protein [Cryptosporangium arvum]|uniref:hypothetical protein n=1 Tax=Cryptosporangium arvum TaxID=80871 RepID=UPI0004B7EF7E|nr:hypothetical protein [Cryptosporangium arvum]
MIAVTDAFPDDHVVVRVRPVGERPVTPAKRALIDAIPHRHSNRRPYEDAAGPDAALVDAAAAEACLLTVRGPAAMIAVADLIADDDDELDRRPGYAAERRRWLRERPATERDPRGPTRRAPNPDERLRRRDHGAHLGTPRRPHESDPCLAVLSSSGTTRSADVRTGRRGSTSCSARPRPT